MKTYIPTPQLINVSHFEDVPLRPNVNTIRPYTGKYSLHTNEQSIYLDTISMANLNSRAKYIQLSSDVFFETKHSPNVWDTPYLYIQWKDHNNNNINEFESGIYPFQACDNPTFSIYSTENPLVWGHAYFYARIPKNKPHHFILGIWNGARVSFFLDNIQVAMYK